MSPGELDKWAAEKLMEWTLKPSHTNLVGEYGISHYFAAEWVDNGKHKYYEFEFNPSDPATGQIWMVVEKMRELGWRLLLDTGDKSMLHIAKFVRYSYSNPNVNYVNEGRYMKDNNPCLAILKAARATGGNTMNNAHIIRREAIVEIYKQTNRELTEEVDQLKRLVREMGNVVDYMSRQWENNAISFAWVQVSEEILSRPEVKKIMEV